MNITPLELRKPDFKRSLRGFSPDEVRAVLSSAAEALEELIRENKELKDRKAALEEKTRSYQNLENTLNETLILAQKAGDSARQAAQREAELITSRAEVEAEKMLAGARARLMELKLEIEELEHQKQAYLLRLRSLVASQWKLLQEEKEEEEKLREIARTAYGDTGEAGPDEDLYGQVPAAETEDADQDEGETAKAEEQPQQEQPEAVEEASTAEAVSGELGEMLDEAASKGAKKEKGGKRSKAAGDQSEKEASAAAGEGEAGDPGNQENPKLFWEEGSDGEDPAGGEDDPASKK
ncbi:MAG: DivIVA domain-containing protein [Candidatus Glassbacteria bacterium]|nr:DivIVA domain-containing protein [Candidatus Glassbacteria bacterium]